MPLEPTCTETLTEIKVTKAPLSRDGSTAVSTALLVQRIKLMFLRSSVMINHHNET
jgi:hypothetical protein